MAARGCGGSRERGGLYIEVGVRDCPPNDPRCFPLEHFLSCPPIPADPVALGIPYRGMALIERADGSGIVDVWDWIGAQHYPNVLDFTEETRRMGVSRLAPSNMDYSNLTSRSRIIFLHERAIVTNADALYDDLEREEAHYGAPRVGKWACPRGIYEHEPEQLWPCETDKQARRPRPMCAALWRELVTGGESSYDPDAPVRSVDRTVGSTTYRARRWFEKHDIVPGTRPEYAPGIFLRLPIHRFAIVSGDTGREAKASTAAARSSLPVARVQE